MNRVESNLNSSARDEHLETDDALSKHETLEQLEAEAHRSGTASDRFTLANRRMLKIELKTQPASDKTRDEPSRDNAREEVSTESVLDGISETSAWSDEVWIKTGAMVAYVGEVEFARESLLEKGVSKMLKKVVTGEATPLTKATGRGQLYLADAGKQIQIIQLHQESLFVRGSALLAMETQVEWDIGVVPRLSAVVASSLFNVQLTGSGVIAMSSHFEPIVLTVTGGQPVVTDPDATIAWSGSLTPEYRTALNLPMFFGRGSGEAVQMEFQGEGFVIVQPYEERLLPS